MASSVVAHPQITAAEVRPTWRLEVIALAGQAAAPAYLVVPAEARPGGGSRAAVKLSGAFAVDGTAQIVADKTLTSDATDVSGVYVLNGGNLVLSNVTVKTTGNTTSQENSSFSGQNAGVFVTKNSRVWRSMAAASTLPAGVPMACSRSARALRLDERRNHYRNGRGRPWRNGHWRRLARHHECGMVQSAFTAA
jgi:hypothetical protein